MNAKIHSDRSFEFYFPELDTLVLVEDSEAQVVIRATRNTFSDRRKAHFLRQLAAEGFIPDRCQWASGFESGWSHVRWVVDGSWLHTGNVAATRKFMAGLLISGALAWLALMAAVLFRWV